MHPADLVRLRLGILGFGVEGRSTLRYLRAHGARDVEIRDANPALTPPDDCPARLGADALRDLDRFDLMFRAPGLPADRPELRAVAAAGRLTSQYRWFLAHCPAPVVGVTGTKGKGTTSTLLAGMLSAAGREVLLGGNVGVPMLDFLDRATARHTVVLELSSFQLEDADRSPAAAVLLAVTQDHLDHHPDRAAYHRAKGNLVRFQRAADLLVVNADCPTARALAASSPARRYEFDAEAPVARGACVQDGHLCWVEGRGVRAPTRSPAPTGETHPLPPWGGGSGWGVTGRGVRAPTRSPAPTDTEGRAPAPFLAVRDLALPGAHNRANALAAALAARQLGASDAAVRECLTTFRGLPHRVQSLGVIGGREWVDDSCSTTPETAIAALRAFPPGRVVVLLGGSDKGADYAALGREVAARSAHAVCYGALGGRLAEAVAAAGARPVGGGAHASFEAAFAAAAAAANEGDVVLLSPACASFDLFADYRARAARFAALVEEWARFGGQ